MGFAPRAKHCSLKGPIHGGSDLVFPHLRNLTGFLSIDSTVLICFESLDKASWKESPKMHLGDHPVAFTIRRGRAKENTLWEAILLQQDKWIKILLGLFQLSLLGNLSLDPRGFVALDVFGAMETQKIYPGWWFVPHFGAREEQVCPLKWFTTCRCHHKRVGHSHGVRGIVVVMG